MSKLALRDYQRQAIDDLRKRWDAGATRVPLVLATGLGKTVIFSTLIQEWLSEPENVGKRALVIAHTNELIEQAAASIKRACPGASVGIVKGALNNTSARIIVSSRQTLASEKRRAQLRRVGLIVIDECFPAGTMVGDKRIEDLRQGDMVPSWDDESGTIVMRPVVATMRKRPSSMIRIELESGETFACTPNHPILTTEGWCPAGLLWRGASVVSFTHDAIASQEQANPAVHGMWEARRHAERAESPVCHVAEDRQGVRYGEVSAHVGEPRFVSQGFAHESCSRFGADEGEQPDGARICTREDEGDTCRDWSQATGSRGEREADTRTSANPRRIPRVADGIDRSAGRRGASVSLQARHRAPDNEGVRGGGRGIPLLAESPRLRSSAGRSPVTSRVADVQVLESGSDGTYGGVCPDGFVYNIEVEGTHTYLIGERGVVAHNCHHAVATNTYGKILKHFGGFAQCEHSHHDTSLDAKACAPCVTDQKVIGPSVKVAGFTATLARSDKAKLSSVWEDCTFKRDIMFGIRNGYLLDVKGERVVVETLDMSNVSMSAGDFSERSLAEELERSFAIEKIAEQYANVASDRKGIAFWPLVATAQHAAEVFSKAGIKSAFVHGGMDKRERRQALADLRSGAIQVVHNAMVLTEGFDDPTVECVVIGRPTKSAPLYQQMVGRALRPDLMLEPSARRPALVLDVTGASEGNDLRSLIDLSPEHHLQGTYDEHPDATLSELEEFFAEMIEEEIGEQRAGASFEYESEEYAGATTTKSFDPLGRTKVWGKTSGGTYYTKASVNAKADAFVFIVDSLEGDPGTYDIVKCSINHGFNPRYDAAPEWAAGTEHVGLHLDMALAWGEDLAGDAFSTRKSAWRKKEASQGLKNMARYLGIDPNLFATAGDLSEAVDAAKADRRIDPLVALVRARVQQSNV